MLPIMQRIGDSGGTQPVAPLEERPYTVVYDGNCKVCNRMIKGLRGWDRKGALAILPSQAPGVKERFPWIAERAFNESLQLVDGSGQTWQGAAAIEQLLELLPRGRLISWVFKVPLMRGLADRSYRWFARNRYRLGCSDHCSTDKR
jgi:predicted DCC family thiol-disulfide oxidoreductase YuxK